MYNGYWGLTVMNEERYEGNAIKNTVCSKSKRMAEVL